jgi:hypothetical protein
MTTVLMPQTGDSARADEAGPGCGCCLPPPDASLPEGRQQALAELQARRDALQRRLEGLR